MQNTLALTHVASKAPTDSQESPSGTINQTRAQIIKWGKSDKHVNKHKPRDNANEAIARAIRETG